MSMTPKYMVTSRASHFRRVLGWLIPLGIVASISSWLVWNQEETGNIGNAAIDVREHPITAPGRIEGLQPETALRTEIPGRIAEILVQERDRVQAGDPLVRLDDANRKYELALALSEQDIAQGQLDRLKNGARPEEKNESQAYYNAALAEVRGAEVRWGRLRAALEKDAISRQEFDDQDALLSTLKARLEAAQSRLNLIQAPPRVDDVRIAEARLAAAQSKVEMARNELDKCTLKAPTSGEILKIHPQVGELTGPESLTPVLILADTSRYFVRAFVEELDAPRVRTGMIARITAQGIPDEIRGGTVVRVSPRMAIKNLHTDRPNELFDTDVREIWIELDSQSKAIHGLRVDVVIDPDSSSPHESPSQESIAPNESPPAQISLDDQAAP